VTRRFVLLAAVLVTLNVVLFFAGPGLALRGAIVSELFGPKMVRLTVLERNGQEWNVDRGLITQVKGCTQTDPAGVNCELVTLREYDGRIQQIPLDSTTDVLRFGRQISESALAPHWRVLITWPADGSPAQSVDVEKVPPRHTQAYG
jgi:hypothetical protein